jgi:glutathione S-transferase
MKLYVAAYAPNPRRVSMFVAEKGISGIETVKVDLTKGAQHEDWFRALNPLGKTPALELDDGSVLTESRAICVYLESKFPEPNLMGRGPEERAFIEMWDRRIEFGLMLPMMMWVRHAHPALAAVEKNQTPEIAAFNQREAITFAHWLDGVLKDRPWIAGDRFTVADITAASGMDFAKLMKWRPEPEFPNIARWRNALGEREAGKVAA